MFIPLLPYLLLLFTTRVEPECQIQSYDPSGNFLQNITYGDYDQNARSYRVGNGSLVFRVWNPDFYTIGGGLTAAVFLKSLCNFLENVGPNYVEEGGIMAILDNVDWSGAVDAPICHDSEPCPDVIKIGTTQLAARVSRGDVLPLTDLLSQYAFSNGQVLSDDFVKQYFYDFFQNGVWYAVPFVSDFRQFFFNRTTFDTLGLKYPPPWGDWTTPWSKSWNWTVFVEYAKNISQSGIGPGFQFLPCWDEELKLGMMIAQNWGATIVTEEFKCGINNTQFKNAMNTTWVKMFIEDRSTNSDWINTTNPIFQQWLEGGEDLDPISIPGADVPSVCPGTDLISMTIDTSSQVYGPGALWNPYTNPNGTIGNGLVPGFRSFLGGSGLMIPRLAPHVDLAWEYILYVTDPSYPTSPLNDMALTAQRSIPPYESAWDLPPWSDSPDWTTAKLQIKKAAPPQYPLPTFPQFEELEFRKPFRFFLLDMYYKNLSIDESVERACKIINFIFLPYCGSENWELSITDCGYDLNRKIIYQWPEGSINVTCRLDVTSVLPDPIVLRCSYIPYGSVTAIVLVTLSGFFVILAFGLGLLIFLKREETINKKWKFSILTIFGCILCLGSVFFMFGYPSWLCVVQVWFMVVGFTLTYGTFCVHMWRIYRISLIKTQHISYSKSIQTDDVYYINVIFGLTGGTVLLLLLWTFVPPVPGSVSTYTTIIGVGDIEEKICGPGSAITITILAFYFVLYFAAGIYTSYESRNIQTPFKERQFLVVSLFTVTLSVVVIIPIVFSVQEYIPKIIIVAVTIIFATTCALLSHVVPKILHSFKVLKLEESRRVNTNAKSSTTEGKSTSTAAPIE